MDVLMIFIEVNPKQEIPRVLKFAAVLTGEGN